MQVAANRVRGQALFETAIILPMFLLVLFGIIWASQSSVIAERTQIAVRFSGLVTNQASQYQNLSLYSIYNASPTMTLSCTSPNDDAIYQNGSYSSGPGTPPFFYPASPSSGACTTSVAVLTGGSLTTPLLFIQTLSTITSHTEAGSLLQSALPGITNVSAQQNYLETPDVPHLLYCYPELAAAVPASIDNTGAHAFAAATPMPSNPDASPLTVDTSCH